MQNSMDGQFDNSFLLDEVRCGFYIPTEIKQAWAAQLEVLQAVDAVCRANDIQYFADWGTLLGAVRHRGFIPWDDDLDIVMKREDYEHFRKVANQLPEGFSIHTFRNEEGFREFHATVVGAPSVSFEAEHLRKFHGFPYMCGLDIFILDYVYADEKKEEERVLNIKYVIGIADAIEDGTSSIETIEYGLAEIERKLNIKLDRKKDNHEMWIYLYELAEKLCGEVDPSEAKELTQMIPWGIVSKNFRFSKELYEKSIRIPFEYTSIPVPVYYDAMLTKRYGNYLKLVKAAGGHEYPFFRAQKDRLQELLDFDMPGYRYSDGMLNVVERSTENWKTIIAEAVNDWFAIIDALVKFGNDVSQRFHLDAEQSEAVLQSVADAQQLIIDIVNLIESVKGEGAIDIQPVEKCCETLFALYNYVNECKDSFDVVIYNGKMIEVEGYAEQIETNIHNVAQRREVIFLSMGADKWEAFSSLYEKECATECTDVYVIPMPIIYKDYDGAALSEVCSIDGYSEDLNIIDYAEYQLELHRPDRIYYQNCFDEYNPAYTVPGNYYSSNLKKNTDDLVYVPWMNVVPFEKEERAYGNLEYCATMPGVVNADRIILAERSVAERYISKLTEWAKADTEESWRSKIEVVEKTEKPTEAAFDKKLLYFIGTSQVLAAGENYFRKMRENLDVFKSSSDKIKVSVVVNGGLETAVSDIKPELISGFEQIEDEYVQAGIEWLIDNKKNNQEISHGIGKYTAYYGDAGYLVPEFIVAGKPVMIQKID